MPDYASVGVGLGARLQVALPVGSSGVYDISACQCWKCQSLDKLWFVSVGPASFKYGWAVESVITAGYVFKRN